MKIPLITVLSYIAKLYYYNSLAHIATMCICIFTGIINFNGDIFTEFTMSNKENSLYLKGRRGDNNDVVVRSKITVSDFVVNLIVQCNYCTVASCM